MNNTDKKIFIATACNTENAIFGIFGQVGISSLAVAEFESIGREPLKPKRLKASRSGQNRVDIEKYNVR